MYCKMRLKLDFNLSTKYKCPNCGNVGNVRVDVVWFGEQPKFLDKIYKYLEMTDIFISIGTSNNVYPAAGFIDFIMQTDRKVKMYEFNIEKTNKSYLFDEVFIGPASKTIPNLLKVYPDFWQGRRDSNSRPTVLETVALPTELHPFNGAGEGNRTLVTSLEGWGFTTKLHPRQKNKKSST